MNMLPLGLRVLHLPIIASLLLFHFLPHLALLSVAFILARRPSLLVARIRFLVTKLLF
jgi:hypothetical protein